MERNYLKVDNWNTETLLHHINTGETVWRIVRKTKGFAASQKSVVIECIRSAPGEGYTAGYISTCDVTNLYPIADAYKSNKEASSLLSKEGY